MLLRKNHLSQPLNNRSSPQQAWAAPRGLCLRHSSLSSKRMFPCGCSHGWLKSPAEEGSGGVRRHRSCCQEMGACPSRGSRAFVCHGPLLNSVLEVPTECVLGRNMLSITALRFKTKAIFLNTGIERLVAIWALPRDDRGSNKYCYELS